MQAMPIYDALLDRDEVEVQVYKLSKRDNAAQRYCIGIQ
jgi:hypothetical protein